MGKKLEELEEEIGKATESLKDFNKFMHSFSEDTAKEELAELLHTLYSVKTLIKLSKIKEVDHPTNSPVKENNESGLVKVRPCAKEYKDKTFIGFYVGDISSGSFVTIKEDKIVCNWSGHNPAIFVPELNKIVYGYESWWSHIDNEEDLKDITDDTISDVWYVKLLKKISKEEK